MSAASNPVPSIASLTPASEAFGGSAFILSVSGSGFIAASTVNWNGTALATTYVGASQLTASVPAGNIADVGSASVTVFNPAPAGGTATAVTFTIDASNPVPSVTTFSPATAVAGSAAFTLTVNGSNFVTASAVNWNGQALATSYVSAAQLTASVPAGNIASATTVSVTVDNPVPGGGASSTANFTINAPVPSVASLSPAGATAGSAAFTLTVNGSNFVTASTVNWNGAALATSYVSAAQLTASVPAGNIASATTVSVTVDNPVAGGGTSAPETFIVNAAIAGAYIRQSAQYTAYPGNNSTAWNVTLNGVQAGSTIYVVGMWPNFVSTYPTMAITDRGSSGSNTYTLLDRYDDTKLFNLGVQGTQSMGHWYAANVSGGSYTINMSPNPQTFEDWVGLVAFEVAGGSSTILDGHTLNFQAGIAPGTNRVNATVTTTVSSGILIAVTFDDIDATAPTEPLAGSGFASVARPLWHFAQVPPTLTGGPSAAAEYAFITSSGAHTATFSPQEGGPQTPDYMTCAAVFQ